MSRHFTALYAFLSHCRTHTPYLYRCVWSGIMCRNCMHECSHAWTTATIVGHNSCEISI